MGSNTGDDNNSLWLVFARTHKIVVAVEGPAVTGDERNHTLNGKIAMHQCLCI